MVKQRNLPDEEEEETENLPLLTTKVVEYLEPVMSRELLCKFPDNSALGFDHSQSSLWSPLVKRNYGRPADPDSATRRDLKLELWEVHEEKNTKTTKKKKQKNKKFLGFDVSAMKRKKMKKVKMDSGFPASPLKVGCFGVATAGWDNVLKAASKHFKKTKKRDPIVSLSNYLKFRET